MRSTAAFRLNGLGADYKNDSVGFEDETAQPRFPVFARGDVMAVEIRREPSEFETGHQLVCEVAHRPNKPACARGGPVILLRPLLLCARRDADSVSIAGGGGRVALKFGGAGPASSRMRGASTMGEYPDNRWSRMPCGSHGGRRRAFTGPVGSRCGAQGVSCA